MTGQEIAVGGTSAQTEQPSKYISALISNINDSAKAVQTSTLALSFVGLYLAAASISINDEDLFRGSSFQISQLGGVSIPIIASFILGPIVFLVLHIQLLLRYRMLAEGVCALSTELRRLPDDDQKRCKRLVANVDFVRMILRWKFNKSTSPSDNEDTSSFDQVTVFLMTTVLPLTVLLVVQISFVRYQNWAITGLQMAVVVVELGAITAFHYWLGSKKRIGRSRTLKEKLRHALFAATLPLLVALVSLVYVRVPAVDNDRIRFWDLPKNEQERPFLQRFAEQPLDMVLCPSVEWGCRFLRLNNRKLVGTQTREDALWKVISESRAGALAAVDGLSLRGRSLRYANFNGSRALKVDLVGDDLRHATFWNAAFQGASLSFAKLQAANLDRAQLQEADLQSALLTGASLKDAQLQGANLQSADLRGVDLTGAQLVGANLNKAQLQGASLKRANLRYANLQQAEFNHTEIDVETHFDFADMRNVNFHPKEEDDETKSAVMAVGATEVIEHGFKARMAVQKYVISDENVDGQVYLTLSKTDSEFSKINSQKVIDETLKYFKLLDSQKASDPAIASGILRRVISFSPINGRSNASELEPCTPPISSEIEKCYRRLVCNLKQKLTEIPSDEKNNKRDYVAVDLMLQLDALSWKCEPVPPFSDECDSAVRRYEANKVADCRPVRMPGVVETLAREQ